MHAHDRLRLLDAMAAADGTVGLVGAKLATEKNLRRTYGRATPMI